jgi:hypothetical protein
MRHGAPRGKAGVEGDGRVLAERGVLARGQRGGAVEVGAEAFTHHADDLAANGLERMVTARSAGWYRCQANQDEMGRVLRQLKLRRYRGGNACGKQAFSHDREDVAARTGRCRASP